MYLERYPPAIFDHFQKNNDQNKILKKEKLEYFAMHTNHSELNRQLEINEPLVISIITMKFEV